MKKASSPAVTWCLISDLSSGEFVTAADALGFRLQKDAYPLVLSYIVDETLTHDTDLAMARLMQAKTKREWHRMAKLIRPVCLGIFGGWREATVEHVVQFVCYMHSFLGRENGVITAILDMNRQPVTPIPGFDPAVIAQCWSDTTFVQSIGQL